MNTIFTEIQKFNKWWHYLFMVLPSVFAILVSYLTINNKIETNDGQKHPFLFYTTIAFAILGGLWFYSMKLVTHIDVNGIAVNYKFIPFATRVIAWQKIENIQIVKYSPFKDYGGWGVRYSKNGWCYNVSGKFGIKLKYKNGNHFLIGTQKLELAQQIIKKYHQLL